jgi:predicted Fe-Mo cluster-binding NifX family protein
MTKVAVSSTGNTLDSIIDPRFGRCSFFIIVDTDTMEFKPVPNPAVDAAGGAGIQAAQVVTAEGVQAVLTGAVGPNAIAALRAAGTQVLSYAAGTVRQAAEAYKQAELQPITTPGPAYAGTGTGTRMGARMGRGGRGGRGRGYGRGGR